VHAALRARSRVERQRPRPLDEIATVSSLPGDESSGLGAVLDEELNRLPDRLRAPLILCCLEGQSRAAAAERLGCSQDAVKGRLERGRDLLRRRLARRGVLVPAAGLLDAIAATASASTTPLPVPVADATVGLALALLHAGEEVPLSPEVSDLLKGVLGDMRTRTVTWAMAMAVVLTAFGAGLTALALHERPSEAPGDPPAQAASKPASTDILPDFPDEPIALEAPGRDSQVFFPDERLLVTYGADGVFIWDTVARRIVARVDGAKGVTTCALSPDGKTILVGDYSGKLSRWEAATGKQLDLPKELAPLGGRHVVALTQDGKRLAVLQEGKRNGDKEQYRIIEVWDVESGKKVQVIEQQKYDVRRMGRPQGFIYPSKGAFAANGSMLIMTARAFSAQSFPSIDYPSVVSIWDVATGKLLLSTEEEEEPVVVSSNGRRIVTRKAPPYSSIQDVKLCVHDLGSDTPVKTIGCCNQEGATIPPPLGALTPDGKTIVGSADLSMKILFIEIASGQVRKTLSIPQDKRRSSRSQLALSPGGLHLALTREGSTTLHLWTRRAKP
jgi:WD40 repeat protein